MEDALCVMVYRHPQELALAAAREQHRRMAQQQLQQHAIKSQVGV